MLPANELNQSLMKSNVPDFLHYISVSLIQEFCSTYTFTFFPLSCSCDSTSWWKSFCDTTERTRLSLKLTQCSNKFLGGRCICSSLKKRDLFRKKYDKAKKKKKNLLNTKIVHLMKSCWSYHRQISLRQMCSTLGKLSTLSKFYFCLYKILRTCLVELNNVFLCIS